IDDNAVVVLENIYRRWEHGETPRVAAEEGAREVVLPVVVATATTLIVFVPFLYLQGELRIYYLPLAIAVGLTLLVSLFVAFTFIPALAARILTARTAPSVIAEASREGPWRMDRSDGEPSRRTGSGSGTGSRAAWYVRAYSALIGFTLRHPWLTITVTALCFAGSYRLFDRYVTRGVIWRGFRTEQTYIDIQITFPRGAGLERTDEMVRYFEAKLAQLPEVERFVTNVTDVFGRIQVTFPDSLELTAVPVVIKERMVAHSYQFGGADVRVYGYGPSFYGGGGSAPNYRIQVLGYNYEDVRRIAEDLGRRLTRFSRVREVNTNATARFFERNRAMQYAVEVDREALGRHDLAVEDVTRRLASAIRGEIVRSSLRLGGDEVRYDVKVSGYRDMDVERLQRLPVATESGSAVRIGDVTRIREQEVLARIRRENQQYERTVAYEFRGPARLGDVVRDAVIDATALPPGYTIEATTGFQFRVEEQRQIYMVLALSLLLIYMVTAALFESLRQPFCVLLTVPMALIGVFLIFFYANASFTREAYIGVIMMGGIVVNNAILLVDRLNRVRREAGGALTDAIVRGTVERVRPILMTTATTVLGLLPLVLFSETADANIWNALGYALIGGLLSSTLFVLTTTPALYLLFERGRSSR
ncbi:MAG: efflux RND transporter permease subunit, partial [Gemmatimonadetes bacterium]|nr:efflux RND transporter permease subunit [Gemmatimonadota bacterium]